MNTVQKQFSDALKREGKTITTYYTNEKVTCLFRINKDYNNIDNHLTIFYDVSAPIKQGQLLSYGGYHYIVLNQETVENDIYYKSALLQCNLLLPVVVNQVNQKIPCYVGELKSPTILEGKVITTIDGRLEIMTESTDMINNISFDTTFAIVGGYYEVVNKYHRSGISYIYVERTEEPPKEYRFDVTASSSQYKVGDTTQLFAIPTINGVLDETAYITYSTSNESIATVDNTGLVTMIVEGTVTITAKWVEQNITDTITIEVIKEVAPVTYTVTLSEKDNPSWDGIKVKFKMNHTFIATFKDNNGNVVTPTATIWTKDLDASKFTIFTSNSDGTCLITINQDYELLGVSFNLTVTDTVLGASGTFNLTIMGLY